MPKVLQAPKQIVMENPAVIPSVPPQRDRTQVISSSPADSDPDPDSYCLCCITTCFFLPGCVAACIDCAH